MPAQLGHGTPVTQSGSKPGRTRAGIPRLDAIDMLRGLVIVIMVLDHVRDFFHIDAARFDPTDPLRTTPILYATRWVTHLCATTFVYLAGVSILLQKANGKSPGELSRFLLLRGLWLIVLEATVVTFGFNFGEPFLFLQVIWAIGASMICMAGLSRLRASWVLGIGVLLLATYPTVAAATADVHGGLGIVRLLLIDRGVVAGQPILAVYALIPWLAVMCLGFGLGPIYGQPPPQRRRQLLGVAVGLLTMFVVLRLLNGYGDPRAWVHLPDRAQTVMSFLNLSKYPPSPDFVCATLGISLLLFLLLEHARGPAARVLLDFGRTPFLTYVSHIYLAHGLMLLAVLVTGAPAAAALNTIGGLLLGSPRPAWGYSLLVVYAIWAAIIATLIPAARWFADIKRRRRDWWLSYL